MALCAYRTNVQHNVPWDSDAMPRQSEYDGYSAQHDADIRQWFGVLPPPPAARVSPHLRARVLAQIEQRRASRCLSVWLPPLWSPTWAAVCVVGLVLSLAVNVWWSIGHFKASMSDPDRGHQPVPVSRHLPDMQQAQALGAVVSARTTFDEQIIGLGFVPYSERLIFFRMGTLYTDSLAALHSEALEVAAPRLRALIAAVEHLQAPRILAAYLHEMQTLLRSRRYAGKELATFLALFESLLEDTYTPTNVVNAATLFQVGAWLENIALAAAVGDAAALRQAPALRYCRRNLTQLDAPPEVLDTLAQLLQLVSAPEITDTDMRTIHTLVTEMQHTLAGMRG
jgi:hypothetical protein